MVCCERSGRIALPQSTGTRRFPRKARSSSGQASRSRQYLRRAREAAGGAEVSWQRGHCERPGLSG